MADHVMRTWERDVEIAGTKYVVRLTHVDKNSWRAVGEYLGESIMTEDRSEGGALSRWRVRAGSVGQ
jgi:hypothetical protein